jgi:uncharacterized membrane protein
MLTILCLYGVVAVVFLGFDAIWLGVVAKGFYAASLATLLADRPNFAVAGLFYAIYILGIVVFVALPACEAGSWGRAAIRGALFGCVAYAAYDLTNLATLRNWPVALTMVDIAWGAFVTAVSAAAGVAIVQAVLGR